MPDAAGAYLLDTFDGAPITVRRTRRKNSIAISIRDGKVNVLAPQRVPEGEIRALIAAKQSWIRAKLQRHAAL
ncbi:MAG: YgjP-like metallopeptidase domain-containing protein, partial [Rickettsiales bacterium]